MKILIVDVDWYNGITTQPNMFCMQLSSYHRQLHDTVCAGLKRYQVSMEYDKIYLVRESISGGLPPIDVKNTKVGLIGKGFKFFSNYEKNLPEVINACAPDYSFYPRSKEKVDRANYVRFTNLSGKPLKEIQDYHGYKDSNITVITDEEFWKLSDEEIKTCLKKTLITEMLGFQKPINPKEFFKHDLQKIFRGRLIYAKFFSFSEPLVETTDVIKAISVLSKLNFSFAKLVEISVNPISFNHEGSNGLAYKDFERCLELAYYAKRKRIKINFTYIDRLQTPLWFLFEELSLWSEFDFHNSFVEHMLAMNCAQHRCTPTELVERPLWFSTPSTKMLMDIARLHTKMLNKYGFCAWGTRNSDFIDFDKIQGRKE